MKTNKKNNLRGRLITMLKPNSAAAEQYRTIRTNIEYSSIDKKIKSLAITSANPGEGKSTTVANVAVVFAQSGKKVLLIDGDLRKPTVHMNLRLDNTRGLINLLVDKLPLEKSVQETGTNNLWALPSGPTPPNPAEVLASQRMQEVLAEAFLHFDLVIFDTPPVLSVTDAQIIGNLCDATLLVTRFNTTERGDILEAKALLDKTQVNLIGTILHGVDVKQENYYLTGA